MTMMERLTMMNPGRQYTLAGGLQQAIDRLALYENAQETLETRLAALPGQLEELRKIGKEKTVRYRELMVRKLTAGQIKAFFEECRIEVDG